MRRITLLLLFLIVIPAFLWSQSEPDKFDVLIKDGTVYDGTGGDPVDADVGIKGDRIVAVGKLARNDASNIIDARGLIVPKIARVSFLPFFRSV
jgi:adenine deaminase